MNAKRIVCLANSRKLGGRCIAGRELVGEGLGPWVRPVSGRADGAVSDMERRYSDGTEPKLLDIITVPVVRAVPHRYQAENWLLDHTWRWGCEGAIKATALDLLLDKVAPLWFSGDSSSGGTNDRVPEVLATGYRSSLRLIRVDELTIRVEMNQFGAPGDRKIRARFDYLGESYLLKITDPSIEHRYGDARYGDHSIGPCYLTISLSEPFKDYVYKLVAAVMPVSAPVAAR